MIPEKIIQFLRGPVIPWVGTCNANLQPHVAWAGAGVYAEEDGARVIVFVPRKIAQDVLADIRETGKMALTAALMPSHETYQCKGRAVDTHEPDQRELALHAVYLEKMKAKVSEMGFPPEFLDQRFAFSPFVAITLQVDDVFDQTPGPGAGKKLV